MYPLSYHGGIYPKPRRARQEIATGVSNRGVMLSGKFAQGAEWFSIVLILCGIVCLCQPFALPLFSNGFTLLLLGWIGLTVFSHRRPVR